MNEMRKLVESIEKIEEGYYKEQDIEHQEEAMRWLKQNQEGEITLDEITRLGRESFQDGKAGVISKEAADHVYKIIRKEWEDIEPAFPKEFGTQGRWAMDYAKKHGKIPAHRGPGEFYVSDKDFPTSADLGLEEDDSDPYDNSDLENDDIQPFFNDEEYEKIKQAMAKRGHTPHSLGANKKGQSMAKDDLAVGGPEYTFDEHFNIINIEFVGPDADVGASELHPEADFDDWLTKNPFESIEEDEIKGVNDKYDDDTLKCKHCGDYYCTSKFGGECPEIQQDLFDDSWPEEETYDEMVEYWKHSLSQSIVRKGVFTQMYDAAGKLGVAIDVLNQAIEDQAHSIAETYHGSGDGIGSSDQNHFIASVARDLGIDDVFGWYKKKEPEIEEAVVEVPRGLRGEDAEVGGATSQDAERFLASLDSEDSVDTNVVDPESGELLDWPTKDTIAKQDQEEYFRQQDEKDEEERQGIFRTPYFPSGDNDMDRAQDGLGKLRWDGDINDFYEITWKNIEDLVDDPQQYYDGDYDIGWDMPVSIKRTDGQKFDDEDHANFKRLSKLFRTATYNIGIGYAGTAESGTQAHFYPSFY